MCLLWMELELCYNLAGAEKLLVFFIFFYSVYFNVNCPFHAVYDVCFGTEDDGYTETGAG